MASTSASVSRVDGVIGRIRTAATNLCSEYQPILVDIRKGLNMIKEIAVEVERDDRTEMVKMLEDTVLGLLEAYSECTYLASAVQNVGNTYQPGSELTDFNKLLDNEVAELKAGSSVVSKNHPFLRQFREAIWNVHHAGQPMPGEEQEDIVMTGTQCNLLNITCPLSGKPLSELADPVRSVDCKHIYEKAAILQYITSKNGSAQCPVAGCPKMLVAARVLCDPSLPIEIEELRSMCKDYQRPEGIEDFTELGEDEMSE